MIFIYNLRLVLHLGNGLSCTSPLERKWFTARRSLLMGPMSSSLMWEVPWGSGWDSLYLASLTWVWTSFSMSGSSTWTGSRKGQDRFFSKILFSESFLKKCNFQRECFINRLDIFIFFSTSDKKQSFSM